MISLGIEEGDYLEVDVEKNQIVLKPRKLIDPSQGWYWTKEWQEMESEADEDIKKDQLSKKFESDEKLSLFLKNPSHPSLRVKQIQGTKNRWEGSITMKYRFTFQFLESGLIFRTIGTHDILNRL